MFSSPKRIIIFGNSSGICDISGCNKEEIDQVAGDE
jgi:hypothetical protein